MSTDWIRQHIKPSLVARYEREMAKIRGDHSDQHTIEENIKKLSAEVEIIETEEERRARIFAEDAEEERHYQERLERERMNKK
jgi:hypothetical protein